MRRGGSEEGREGGGEEGRNDELVCTECTKYINMCFVLSTGVGLCVIFSIYRCWSVLFLAQTLHYVCYF